MIGQSRTTNYQMITSASKINKYFKKMKLLKKSEREAAETLNFIASCYSKQELQIMKQTLNNNLSNANSRQAAFTSLITFLIALIAILVSAGVFNDKSNGVVALSFLTLAYILMFGVQFWYNTSHQDRFESYKNYLELLISLKG